ncbi:hypothetical protein LUZ60_000528 [Juncus effusus]|nr:hypothetical protein LUZ60_000528 [Juncus effusus]
MARFVLSLLFSLLVFAATSHATRLPAQVYWDAVLNTPMIASITDLLNTDVTPSDVDICSVPDKSRVEYFFLEKDLHHGLKMTLQFSKAEGPKFLSKHEAELVPFSSEKLPEILSRFSVKPGSEEENVMKETLTECEKPPVKGETKLCATSVESMVDFSVESLGTTDMKPVSTIIYGNDERPKQEYTVVSSGIKSINLDEFVICHKQPYAYAVFYCHLAISTNGYMVRMTGKDGSIVDALAICHADTSAWNPKNIVFEVLKVKPGMESICHFLTQDHVVWNRNFASEEIIKKN